MSERFSGSELATIGVVSLIVGLIALKLMFWVIATVFLAIKLILVVVVVAIAWRAGTAVLGAGAKRKELGR